MKRNAVVIGLAVIIMLVGFSGNFIIGRLINPPAQKVVAAQVNIPAGSVIQPSMLVVADVSVPRSLLATLITESEVGTFVGGRAAVDIPALQLVTKNMIVADGNPAAQQRLALTLSDPSLVAMVVPIDPAVAPLGITIGDYVDLIMGVGNPANNEKLTTAPTATPDNSQGFAGQPTAIAAVLTAHGADTPTPEPRLFLPVAKTVVSNAKVLSVVRAQAQAQTNAQGTPVAPEAGKPIGLVIAIPRQAQEIVEFALTNGSLRVSLLSPNVGSVKPGDRQPTLGMTWDDLVALVRMERQSALNAGTPSVEYGPGAYAVESTQNAQAAATQAVLTSMTQTAGPGVIGGNNNAHAAVVNPTATSTPPAPLATPKK
jgi:hypothetical protein